jgi:hypothetical protein
VAAVRLCVLLLLLALSPAARADTEKLHFDAYSLQVPPPAGWLVTRGGGYDVAFAAALSATHTWAMTAAAIPLAQRFESDPAFLAHVRDRFLRDSDPARFRILATDGRVERLHGATCAWLAVKAEEGPHFVIEVTQVTCIHPSATGLAIEVGYHERYPPGEASGAFNQMGERFIRSVRFWRPVPGAVTARRAQ